MQNNASHSYAEQAKQSREFLESNTARRVKFVIFKSSFFSWEKLFSDAADFANRLPPEALINISHSADQGKGVVTVWYWKQETA